jgi:transposase
MDEEFRHLVGIDWGEDSYQVCVLTGGGRIICERVVEHSGQALARFASELLKLSEGQPLTMAVAIETNRGAMVETLIEKGFAVYTINPKQLDRFRDRHTVAGAKDDRRDAFVLADSLRSDRHLFRRLKLDDPMLIELREFSRIREDLADELRRLTNQLRQQLHRYFPQVLRLSSAADEPWIWALLKVVPTPAAARGMSPHRLEKILKEHRIRRFDVVGVAEILDTDALPVAPGVTKAASAHIKLLLERIVLANEQLHECERNLDGLLERMQTESEIPEHHGVRILLSVPGIGRLVAATMLAEASEHLWHADYSSLRCLCGVAPVTRRSGKSLRIVMRMACSHRLRNAVYHMARTHVQHDENGKRLYAAMRARGLGHARALRGVADRVLRTLTVMIRNDAVYKPADAICEIPLEISAMTA